MPSNSFSLLSLDDGDESDGATGETFVLEAMVSARHARRALARNGGRTALRAAADEEGCDAEGDDSDEVDNAASALAATSLRTPKRAAVESGESAEGDPAEMGLDASASSTGGSHPRSRMPRPFGHNSMLWLDLEMTGLDPHADHILELACVLSDGGLTRFVEGPDLVISHSEAVLAGMNDWCLRQHASSGLIERVRASTLSLRQAEEQVLAFVRAHASPGVLNLAGNCVYKDKEFLERHMPELMAALSWRVIDVSTVNELAYRWFPNALRKMPRKKSGHRAMADVYESIEELKYYRKALFKPPPPQSAGKR